MTDPELDDVTIDGSDLLDEIRRHLGFEQPGSQDLTIDGFDLLREIVAEAEIPTPLPLPAVPLPAVPLPAVSSSAVRWNPPRPQASPRPEQSWRSTPMSPTAIVLGFLLGVAITTLVMISGAFG